MGKGRRSRDFALKTHLRSANGALEEMFREYDDGMRVGGRCKLGFGFYESCDNNLLLNFDGQSR